MSLEEVPSELLRKVEFEQHSVKDHFVDINQQLDVVLESTKTNFRNEKDISEIAVHITFPGKYFVLEKLAKKIIHHIGRWWWKDNIKSDEDYETILKLSLQALNSSIDSFGHIIKTVLHINQMVIRYFEKGGCNFVYGIVSQSFKPSNQLEFRKLFIDIATRKELINPKTLYKDHYFKESLGEFFQGKESIKDVGFNYGLYYGLNNGYAAYKVIAHRYTKNDKSWLTPLKVNTSFRYKNDSHTTVEEFVKGVATFMELQFSALESNIENLKHAEFEKTLFEELYSKLEMKLQKRDLEVFNASFKQKWDLGKKNTGRTTWTIVTSFLNIGTYERFSDDKTRWMLMELGTDVLERNGLKSFLESNSQIGSEKKYNNLPSKVITE